MVARGQGEVATKLKGDKDDIAIATRINISRTGGSDAIPEEFEDHEATLNQRLGMARGQGINEAAIS